MKSYICLYILDNHCCCCAISEQKILWNQQKMKLFSKLISRNIFYTQWKWNWCFISVFTWVIAYRYLILESTIKDLVTGRSTLRLMNLKLLWNLMYQSEAPWLNLWPFVDGKVHRVIHKIEVTNNLQSYSFIVALQLKQCSLYILQASCRSSFALVSCCNNEFLSNLLQWKKKEAICHQLSTNGEMRSPSASKCLQVVLAMISFYLWKIAPIDKHFIPSFVFLSVTVPISLSKRKILPIFKMCPSFMTQSVVVSSASAGHAKQRRRMQRRIL